MGAYDRERVAYASLLSRDLPVPRCYDIIEVEHGPAFVLEDLTAHRAVDQIEGLSGEDALAVVDALVVCHTGIPVSVAADLGVRSATPAGFSPESLTKGLALVPDGDRFAQLLERRGELVARFGSLSDPVLCHGDPRADNLVLGPQVKLFDWQQIAIQTGEADLAWLMATSLSPMVRTVVEAEVVTRYASAVGRSADESWERYRLAMIVPGLAVLLLAQRSASGRLQELVSVSIDRIASAAADHL